MLRLYQCSCVARSVVNVCLLIVASLLKNCLWDFKCRRIAFTMPSNGLLAFFTVVASSQISPHTAFVQAFIVCKDRCFLFICSILRCFFYYAVFFNLLYGPVFLFCSKLCNVFACCGVNDVRGNLCQRLKDKIAQVHQGVGDG